MPDLSVVLLSWDGLELTRRCVESLRAGTEGNLEIVIVDNGSGPDVRDSIPDLADRWQLNEENLGFAAGMNQGLALVTAPVVVFANNDTVFPSGWDKYLLETLSTQSNPGMVVPAVTASGNPRTVRSAPGRSVERLLPFSEPPSGIVYLMRTDLARDLGGWSTDYRIASGEDWDLCFSIWLRGLEIFYDTRVLVEHISKGTASEKLGDWQSLWRENRNRFLQKWSEVDNWRYPGIDEVRRSQAKVVVEWMRSFYHTRDELLQAKREMAEQAKQVRSLEKRASELRQRASLGYQLRRVPLRAVRKFRHITARASGRSD